MKKAAGIFLMCIIAFNTFAQQQNNIENSILELSRIYKKFSYKVEPSAEIYVKLKSVKDKNLKGTVEFIRQAITANNSLSRQNFLTKPDSLTLKYLYAVRDLATRMAESDSDNIILVKEVLANNISQYLLVDCYYNMLFNGMVFKNRPFNMSKMNFQLDKYKLPEDWQKSVFVLQLTSACWKELETTLNESKTNFESSYDVIKRFPKINGLEYFKFTEFNFPDFEKTIAGKSQSYKQFYLDRYFNLLLTHLDCIDNCKNQNISWERDQLVNGSILKETAYYKYSHNQEALKKLNPVVNQD